MLSATYLSEDSGENYLMKNREEEVMDIEDNG